MPGKAKQVFQKTTRRLRERGLSPAAARKKAFNRLERRGVGREGNKALRKDVRGQVADRRRAKGLPTRRDNRLAREAAAQQPQAPVQPQPQAFPQPGPGFGGRFNDFMSQQQFGRPDAQFGENGTFMQQFQGQNIDPGRPAFNDLVGRFPPGTTAQDLFGGMGQGLGQGLQQHFGVFPPGFNPNLPPGFAPPQGPNQFNLGQAQGVGQPQQQPMQRPNPPFAGGGFNPFQGGFF